jgi:hypothetical protein
MQEGIERGVAEFKRRGDPWASLQMALMHYVVLSNLANPLSAGLALCRLSLYHPHDCWLINNDLLTGILFEHVARCNVAAGQRNRTRKAHFFAILAGNSYIKAGLVCLLFVLLQRQLLLNGRAQRGG